MATQDPLAQLYAYPRFDPDHPWFILDRYSRYHTHIEKDIIYCPIQDQSTVFPWQSTRRQGCFGTLTDKIFEILYSD